MVENSCEKTEQKDSVNWGELIESGEITVQEQVRFNARKDSYYFIPVDNNGDPCQKEQDKISRCYGFVPVKVIDREYTILNI